MPSYITSAQTQQVTALYPGQSKALINNAATDASVTTTLQTFIAPTSGNGVDTFNVENSTNQTMTGQIAQVDSTANYQPYVGMVVAANTATSFNVSNCWVRFTCTAPTSGSLIIGR